MKIRSPQLDNIPGIEYFFGSLEDPYGQGDGSAPLDWVQCKPDWKQVHGTHVGEVVQSCQNLGEVDGSYSRIGGQWVAAVHADCVPVLLTRKDGSEVSALHAGWRGVFISEWSTLYNKTGDWVAVLGPSIQACCFEVGDDLRDEFLKKYSSILPDWEINPRAGRTLNLHRILEAQLISVGVREVERIPLCTACAKNPAKSPAIPWFSSFRRDKKTSLQLSGIRRQVFPGTSLT
jgi:YfiH family protein